MYNSVCLLENCTGGPYMYMYDVLYTYWLSDYITKIGNHPWDKESHYNGEDFIPKCGLYRGVTQYM